MTSQDKKPNDRNGNKSREPAGLKAAFGAVAKDLWIVILDIIAVNLSYFLALMIRFYVHSSLSPIASDYLSDFAKFAPFYTVLCIIVFALFKLYNGMWRYAGINDMNRIIAASAVTCLIQAVGTALFVRRMPITYYIIGALIQFVFIFIIRFAYRFVVVEQKKIAGRNLPAINVMIVGVGEISHRVIKQLEDASAYRPVCVIDNKSYTDGKMFDGIPILSGGVHLEETVAKYGVKAIFIADPALPAESRESIKRFCKGKEIELQDYTGYLSNLTGRVSLTGLLETVKCPVMIKNGGKDKEYANGLEALVDLNDHYTVSSISAAGGKLVIELKQNTTEAYARYEEWLKKHKEETGEDVSYF